MKKTILRKLFTMLGFKRQYSQDEKKTILFQKLVKSYKDYDETTGSVDIHPAIRARKAVVSMENRGLINYYFDLLLLYKKHQLEFATLNKKYGV